jgi:hypothetical protein
VKTPVKFIEFNPNNQWIWTSHGVADLQSNKIIYDDYLGNTIASYIENSILIGSSFLAYQIRKDTKAFSENSNKNIAFGKYKLPIKIITEGRIKKLFYDSSIGLFISTPGKFFFVDGNENLNVPSDIIAIAKQNNHEVYLSAFNNGLYQFNIKKNKISQLNYLQNITSIEKIKIKDNAVYFLSNNQLFQYHNNQLVNLNNKIGTYSSKINDFELKDNQILLA